MTQTYNRRTVLAGLGAVGVTAFGTQAVRGRSPPYTHYTYAQTDSDTGGIRLSVAWYETYNGKFQEAQNASTETNATRVTDPDQVPYYVAEANGPIVTLGNVLPGDSGSVQIGLLADRAPELPIEVWFRPVLRANDENGVVEPEIRDAREDDPGDGSSDGELAGATQVRFYKDDGIIGGCDGEFWLTDTPISDRGPMDAVFDDLEVGVNLTDDGCLAEGERRCFGFTWELPAGTGNHVQTDSVSFDLEFVAVECETGNPWIDGGSA